VFIIKFKYKLKKIGSSQNKKKKKKKKEKNGFFKKIKKIGIVISKNQIKTLKLNCL